MATWIVTNRITGEVVHAYTADEPYPFDGMGFDVCNHTAEVQPPMPPSDRELTKRAWRLLFTPAEQKLIDRFNATFESNTQLTEDQRDAVRSGLEDYKAATAVNKDDPATAAVLGLYVALGLLGANRPDEILA
jgi:hypothetical protein